MNRSLQYCNLAGVLVLMILCALQWRVNRQANLAVSALEKTRLEQAAELEDQNKRIKGYAADLDGFREQLARASSALKETETKLGTAERQALQLGAERDQLRMSVTNWAAAVRARDEQLKGANDHLRKLADDRDEAVVRFNELAERYNAVVKDFNDLQAKLVASRTNAAPSSRQP